MATVHEYQNLLNQLAALREQLADQLASQINQNPQIAEDIVNQLDDMLNNVVAEERQKPPPPDQGLAELAGIGPQAADELGETRVPSLIVPYDERVTAERIMAVGDLYYLYQHEKIGIFHALLKLQELFKAGAVRLSDGEGAFRLYQFDRRQVLRYTYKDRQQAYRRVFGYTNAPPASGAEPNRDFHRQYTHFVGEVAQFFRDKRISEVIRPQSDRGTFGSVAVVRRSGLDLRNGLKHASYGHINVMRVEVLQLLDEAFRILEAEDIERLFGADNAWDVVEEVMRRYLNRPQIQASQRSRMAIAGRSVIHWLAQAHILNASRVEFETLLTDIADDAEEWLTSAEALGIAQPRAGSRVMPLASPAVARATVPGASAAARSNGNGSAALVREEFGMY
jgi:hypothetical protein